MNTMNTKTSLKLPHDYLHKLHEQAHVLRNSTKANKCQAHVSSSNKLHEHAQVLRHSTQANKFTAQSYLTKSISLHGC